MNRLLCAVAVFGWAASVSLHAAEIDPLDWPNWRGPEQNNSSRETGLVDKWRPSGGEGSNLLWKRDDLGSRSTPIVLRGKLYTLVRDQPETEFEGEKVVCVDAATGETIWEHRFNVYLSDVPDTRVGWSSCVADPETGRVYAQGVCGYFCCLEGDTGEVVWERSLHEEFGLLSTYGGRTNIPVIFEDLVIASAVVIGWDEMAKPAHRFMAFNKADGQMVWFNGTRLIPDDTTYSTPVIKVLGGQEAMVFGSGDGQVWAMQPRTGVHIWNYPFSRRGLNVSPLVDGDTVYTGHSEENIVGTAMGSLVALDGTTGKEKWSLEGLMVGKSSPVMVGDKLLAIDDRAKLRTFDPATGEMEFYQALGTVQRATPLVADGKVYTITQSGRWYVMRPQGRGLRLVDRQRLGGEECDGSPIVSHGRIYLPTSNNLYCIGQEDHTPQADPLPPAPTAKAVSDNPAPAHVQVVPCEVLLSPGGKQKFTTELFNSLGQPLDMAADGAFTLEGPGEIDAEGNYTAPSVPQHTAAFVTYKLGEHTGRARIRIVPPLPWKFTFDEAEDVPITWVGGRVRHVIREVDGEKVAVKKNILPAGPGKTTKLGTKSRGWMGPSDMSDYTIQADVQGTIEGGKMPDIGLINQRYTMTLRGEYQDLRLYSWVSHDKRTQATVPYEWKPGVWYVMKLSAAPGDGKSTVRGKVWPRGEAEPDDWMIEISDTAPNLQGSPGLFGNASEAEFFLDNIEVTKN